LPDFSVVLTDRAIADLDGLALKVRLQIAQDVASLARDPLPPRSTVKKLMGYRPALYRQGAGDYRVLFRVAQGTVTVLRAIDRRDLDRIL
jgi:mRNA-degrading endonuclease RelE of RelBE toxin-antitoxin system